MFKKLAAVTLAVLALTGCSSQTPEEENWTATPDVVDTTIHSTHYSITDPSNKCISYEFEMPGHSPSEQNSYYTEAEFDFEDRFLFANWRQQGSDSLQHAIVKYLKEYPETKLSLSENCPSQERLDEVHIKQQKLIEKLKLDQKLAIEKLQLEQKESTELYNSQIAKLEACMLTDVNEPISTECSFY
jgi:uncharacterized protein YcfL